MGTARIENYFSIVVQGERFDVDKYAKRSLLTISSRWRRGERRTGSDACYTRSGMEIILGRGPKLDFAEQQAIAAAYLEANQACLKKLRSAPGVAVFYLGLQEVVFPDSLGSIMDISPLLMKIALKIGIQVTVWASLNPTPHRARVKTKKTR